METLGLSGTREREDNFFQRLFWPTLRNSYDADLISRRGFWVSFAVGVVSAGMLAISGQLLIAILMFVFYLLGAAGIRMYSLAASVVIAFMYALEQTTQVAGMIRGTLPLHNPLLGLVCLALLLATVRATLLTRRWLLQGTHEPPESQDSGLVDVLVNRMPQSIWPTGKYVFYGLSVAYGALSLVGLYVMLIKSGTH